VVSHGGIGRILRKHFLSLEVAQIEEYIVRQDAVYVWKSGEELIV